MSLDRGNGAAVASIETPAPFRRAILVFLLVLKLAVLGGVQYLTLSLNAGSNLHAYKALAMGLLALEWGVVSGVIMMLLVTKTTVTISKTPTPPAAA